MNLYNEITYNNTIKKINNNYHKERVIVMHSIKLNSYLLEKEIGKINKKVSTEFPGWNFDYDDEKKSFFISTFDRTNRNEELIFYISQDFQNITEKLRYGSDNKFRRITKENYTMNIFDTVFNFLKDDVDSLRKKIDSILISA